MRQIVDTLHAKGSFVVLIGVPSVSLRDKNQSRFEALAEEKGLLYVPNILDDILHSPKLMSDYIHPNDAGYAAIADRLETVLRPHLVNLVVK